MMQENYLESYLSNGVERILKGIVKMSVLSPGKGAFFIRFSKEEKQARLIRQELEKNGVHIPPFLIASITTKCNLQCKGCYAHANQSCSDGFATEELDKEQWGIIFSQASKLGIPFILLAGGEPLTRREILEEAASHKGILFPVFTNGTLLDQEMLQLFAASHNLLPILSMEGSLKRTDERRGAGVYEQLEENMAILTKKHILFGASVTVTQENQEEVLSEEFTQIVSGYGCKAVIYVEYVPADRKSMHLALDEAARTHMEAQLKFLRGQKTDMLFISFPGDEKQAGGCLAAGRGFFHISASGKAEPCPFSPYSDTNVLQTGLKGALSSPLFVKIRTGALLSEEHSGGCVLFEKEEQVKEYWKDGAQ